MRRSIDIQPQPPELIRVSIVLLSTLLILPGCEGNEATDDNPSLSLYAASKALTYGSDEGPGMLASVFSVGVSPAGDVFASQPSLGEVTVFSRDGSFSGTVGRRGDGPGEFQNPGAVRFRADTLTVLDFQSGISLFAPDGQFLHRVFFTLDPPPGRSFPLRPITLLSDGTVGCFSPVSQTETLLRGVENHFWLRTSRHGEVLDTLIVQPLAGAHSLVETAGSGTLTLTHPLAWNDLSSVPPDGSEFVLVDRSAGLNAEAPVFKVYRVNLDGDTVGTGAIPYEPMEITSDQKDSLSLRLAIPRAERRNMQPERLKDLIRDQIRWPPHHPPVTDVLAGSDGSVWLRRESVSGDSIRWDILDAYLDLTGSTILPSNLDVKVVSSGSVWGVELDEFDVPRIVRFDLRK